MQLQRRKKLIKCLMERNKAFILPNSVNEQELLNTSKKEFADDEKIVLFLGHLLKKKVTALHY